MKNIIYGLMRFLSRFIRKDNKLITIIFRGYSGSNLSPIIERLSDDKYKNYKVKIIYEGNSYYDYLSGNISRLELYKARIEKYISLLRSNLVLSTHGAYKFRYDNTMINFWHGIPMKSMSLMNKSKTDKVHYLKDDYFLSTSEFFNTIMNSCMGLPVDKYYITGYPRNDYLLNEDGVKNLNILLNKKIEGKIILYMPTYRNDREEIGLDDNIFGIFEFNTETFYEFLENNNITLLLKLHPNEERILISKYKQYVGKRIILISNLDLESKKMDLYKIINAVDLLITDYSSIYFDYLLLDRPIIFTPVDLEYYRDTRGLLLEPYEFWTPGPKCIKQQSLQDEIVRSLNNLEYYKPERENIKNIMHKYKDTNSTDRAMSLIEEIMEG